MVTGHVLTLQSSGIKQAEGVVDLAADVLEKEVEAVLKALASKPVVSAPLLMTLCQDHDFPRACAVTNVLLYSLSVAQEVGL
jgi:hypothetical protein